MKLKENMAKKDVQKLKDRLVEVLNSKNGFIILADDNKITDFYQGVCPDCVVGKVGEAVIDFARLYGLPHSSCFKKGNNEQNN